MRWSNVCLSLAAAAAGALALSSQVRTTEKKVTETFFVTSPEHPLTVTAPAVPIRDQLSVPAPAAPAATDICVQAFCNSQWNSRIGRPVGHGEWSLRWKADLNSGVQPGTVLDGGDRVLVHGMDAWQLFDSGGKSAGDGRLGPGMVSLDAPHGLFYIADTLGFIGARKLADGSEVFAASAWFGSDFQRTLIARRGRRLWVTSQERQVQSRGGRKPSLSVVELRDLGDPLLVNQGMLESAKEVTNLMRRDLLTLTALREDRLVAAIQGHIYFFDPDLRVRSILEGDFVPVALSLDEASRVYLVADTRQGRALWVLTPEGQRTSAFTAPAGFQIGSAPPLVGYNHRVYLIGDRRVIAVGPDGKLLWERTAEAPVAGAVTTADNQLLVAAGGAITAWNAAGEPRVLYRLDSDALQTAPVLTSRGELLAASRTKLYCLVSR